VPCASIASAQPSWVADKQVATIQGGVTLQLTITFRPANTVSAATSFVGDIVQVSIGVSDIEVVLSDGTVEASGQLGNPPLYMAQVFGPVPALTNVVQIADSSGAGQACALLQTGTVECWGYNGFGQLGNGTTTSSATPVPVTGLTGIGQIVAGGQHMCAIALNGALSCWGQNTSGQLGNGTTTNSSVPVPGPREGAATFNTVALGGAHTCGFIGSVIYCWGNNAYGQLGDNTTTNETGPQQNPVFFGATQVALGNAHTCAVRGDGSVYCWGYNGYGQLGTGNTTNSLTPVKVPISGVAQIAAGFYGNCARKGDGTVWCWGGDGNGQVGDGTQSTVILSPTQVPGLPPSAAIFGGAYDFCSLGTDSSLWCWGDNGAGQLGNGRIYDIAIVPRLVKL
jgi:alpha-tubulin suppressor-like RCC1 family protein